MSNSSTTNLNRPTTIVFIDAGVEKSQQLIEGVVPKAEVFILERTADGIEQISKVLQHRQNIEAVHIISHGSPGCLDLGNSQLSLETLNHYAAQLQQWNVANLFLYGCNVAAGDAGAELISKLHALTKAEIAASNTLTGNAAKGGNWNLEVTTREAQFTAVFSPEVMATYPGVMGVILEVEPNNTIATAQVIPSSAFSLAYRGDIQTLDGTNISTIFPHVTIPGTGNGTADYFRINATANQRFIFDIDASTFNADLTLYDTNGNKLAYSDNNPEVGNTASLNPSGSPWIEYTFTTAGSYVIKVDQYFKEDEVIIGSSIPQNNSYRLHIVNGDAPPTSLTLSNNSIDENAPSSDLLVGNFTSTDPNPGDTFTYSLVSGAGDTDNGSFTVTSDGKLTIKASPDFEAKSWYNIRVQTTDQTELSYAQGFVINVNDINEAPTDISISKTSIDENVAAGSTVGLLSSTDPDNTDNTFTYQLVPGEGSTDNGAFTIVDNQLRINNSPDFETQPSYNILVQTKDAGGLSYTEPLTITVNNLDENLTVTAPGGLFNGTNGNDNITGSAIIDRIYGYAGNDTITANGGDDLVYGGNGNDLINGGAGGDRLYGDAGDDVLNGDAGIDILYGGDGNDILNGGAGSDRLYGDAGNDTFVLAKGMGQDLIYGFQDGADKIRLDGLDFDTEIKITPSGTSTLIQTTTGETLASLVNTNSSLITKDDFISSGKVIYGTAGNDTLQGGSGNDTLIGNGGSDTFIGGEGKDIFVLNPTYLNRSIIHDFQDGIDKLALAEGFSLNNLGWIIPFENSTRIFYNLDGLASVFVTLANTNAALISKQDDFINLSNP